MNSGLHESETEGSGAEVAGGLSNSRTGRPASTVDLSLSVSIIKWP